MKAPAANYVVAEEAGLVTIQLAAVSGRAPGTGVRLRLTPPRALLREDEHLFDEKDAAPLVKKAIAAADVPWTDTAIGCGVVTVSFGAKTKKDASAVQTRLEALDVKPWKIREVLVTSDNAERLRRLHDEASWAAAPKGVKPDARLAKALAKEKPEGPGLYERCELSTKKPSLAAVKKGLLWLNGELERIEPIVLSALKTAPEGTRLGLVINAHPRQRRVDFQLVGADDGDDTELVSLEDGRALVLERLLGAPRDQIRRIAGILWKNNHVKALPKAKRIDIIAES
ncbi:Hypothetical protein A7982_10829 [Minicystis rosea]|nr:Hypothetical protein A7982_10829 [Minicystis rosea]